MKALQKETSAGADSIGARIRSTFSRRASAVSVLAPMVDLVKSSLGGTKASPAQAALADTVGRGGAGHTQQQRPTSLVVDAACNSQQDPPAARHRRSAERASTVTTSTADNSDARTITTTSSADVSHQGSTREGLTPRNTTHDADGTRDSAASSFSFSSSNFRDAPEIQPLLDFDPEPSAPSLAPPSPDLTASEQTDPSPVVGLCHEDGPAAELDFFGHGTAALACALVTPTSSMSAAPVDPADSQASLLRALLQVTQGGGSDGASADASRAAGARAEIRKIWVKRPGGSATLIPIRSTALVDDLRDLILRKYANSIGRHFDSPDLYLHITPRDKRPARPLGPEELLSETLDSFYPGGQAVDEALVILVPQPARPSPRPAAPHPGAAHYPPEFGLPSESAEGYFPPVGSSSATLAPPIVPGTDPSSHAPAASSGKPPSVPSPGSGRAQAFVDRPRLGLSPSAAVQGKPPPVPNPNEPHPPVAAPNPNPYNPAPSDATPTTQVSTPPARTSSPRPSKKKARKTEKQLPPVPPINVLLVEDNPINLKLLEAFAKGLKVRWQSAMNGQDAVTKWRSGGFHLVLMDIQLPVMNGLEATREIRRLERENSIGVFTSSTGRAPGEEGQMKEEDRLPNIEMFKSPVIIVALTASSLQSDRHEALAAGCNDFITKPVSFPWLETKVREWGCMQALIDFEGWRSWKTFSEAEEKDAAKKAPAAKPKAKKSRSAQVAAIS